MRRKTVFFWLVFGVTILSSVLPVVFHSPQNISNTTMTTTTASSTTMTVIPTTTSTTVPPTTTSPTTTVPPTTAPIVNLNTYYVSIDAKNGNKFASGYQDINALVSKFDSNDNMIWYITESSSGFSIFGEVRGTPDGNVYTMGNIDGNVLHDFGNGVTLTGPTPGNNLVVVKYNSSGIAQWARTTVSFTSGQFYGGGAYGNDEIFGIGYYRQTPVDFGNGVIAAGGYGSGNPTGVVVKYNSSGIAQWAKTEISSGFGNSLWVGVSVNSTDQSVYAVGFMYTAGTSANHDLGDGVIIFTDGSSFNIPIIIKYSQSGITQWGMVTTQTPFTSGEHQYYECVTSGEYIYVVGVLGDSAGGPVNFGNGVTLVGNQGQQTLIVKYNSDGNTIWARTTTSQSNWCRLNGVSIGLDGNIYTTGRMYGTGSFDFGNGVIISGGVNDYNEMIVVYSPNGDTLWASSTLSGTSYSDAYGITVENSKIYSAGYAGGLNVVFNATVVDIGTYAAGVNRFILSN